MKNTLLALTLTAGSAFAQQPAPPAAAAQVDARFEAWVGCWRLDDDLAGTGARMCITPEKGGVRMQTLVGTQRGIDEIVIGDAIGHPIADAECKGTELAEWSADGARLFRTTAVTCGKEAPRTIKSVAFMAPGPSWINVQHVSGAAADTAVRVQRYRRAANQQLADGSKAPQPEPGLALRTSPETTKWSIEDVIEASSKVPAAVVQAALTEVHHGFDLNKRTLVLLDDGGVDKGVIDLMVALTYPKRFVVQRLGGGTTPTGILTGGGWYDPMVSPMINHVRRGVQADPTQERVDWHQGVGFFERVLGRINKQPRTLVDEVRIQPFQLRDRPLDELQALATPLDDPGADHRTECADDRTSDRGGHRNDGRAVERVHGCTG